MGEYVGSGMYWLYLFDRAATYRVEPYEDMTRIVFRGYGISMFTIRGASFWGDGFEYEPYNNIDHSYDEIINGVTEESEVFFTWSNHNIYDDDGCLYYQGTNYDGTYNGVVLPEIPDDLLLKYPYAVIVETKMLKEEEPEPYDHRAFQVGIATGLACDGWYKGETAEEETEVNPFLQGVEIGRKIKAQRLAKQEPVAYMYNGVQLPELPEWDKETYPYAFINGDDTYYMLHVTDKPLKAIDGYMRSEEGTVAHEYSELGDGVWKKFYQTNIIAGVHTLLLPMWSNRDVLNEDGSVYLSASEPIPVYE